MPNPNVFVELQRAIASFTNAAGSMKGFMLPHSLTESEAENALRNLNLIISQINLWYQFNGDCSVFDKIRSGLKG
jgi:hypothetical protein